MELFPSPPPLIREELSRVLALADSLFPVPSRFRARIPAQTAELSRLLTGGAGERSGSYLEDPPLLSAYLRYFLPWNLYRLSRLLPSLPLDLGPGDTVIDLGSGPLTLPLALWISRPELRETELLFHCIDRTGAVLEAGKKLFRALAGEAPWKLRTQRTLLGPGRARVQGQARLVTAINVFNELCPRGGSLRPQAAWGARLLSALAGEGGRILVVEPGIPRSGEFCGLLREALMAEGQRPLSPCPHDGPCPLAGAGKWCHFALDTKTAPQGLHRLSAAAGLPKERATLCFLLSGPPGAVPPAPGPDAAGTLTLRVISGPFPLPGGRTGRYGCSGAGLVLVSGQGSLGAEQQPGALLQVKPPEKRDPKSGALCVDLG